ncbi:uncharacterized protein AAEQ78_005898 [Lycaon pictus]
MAAPARAGHGDVSQGAGPRPEASWRSRAKPVGCRNERGVALLWRVGGASVRLPALAPSGLGRDADQSGPLAGGRPGYPGGRLTGASVHVASPVRGSTLLRACETELPQRPRTFVTVRGGPGRRPAIFWGRPDAGWCWTRACPSQMPGEGESVVHPCLKGGHPPRLPLEALLNTALGDRGSILPVGQDHCGDASPFLL